MVLKRKRWLSMLMACLLGLTACGPQDHVAGAGGESKEKPKQLVIWENEDPIELANTKKLAKQYEQKTGIHVKIVTIKMLDQPKKLTLDGPAGKGPDLITFPHDNIGDTVLKGLIRPLQVDESVKDQYSAPAIQAMTYEGKLYGLPKATESVALIYNKKLMPKPPATFEELIRFAKDFTKPEQKKYGLLFEANNFYYDFFLFDNAGGYVFKVKDGMFDTNDIGLNNAGSQKAVRMIGDWYREKLLPQGIKADVVNGLFKEGKVAAVINGPWAVKDYQQAGIDIGVAPLPKLNGKDPRTFIGVKGWYVSSYSKHADWATDLARFLTSHDALKSRFQDTKQIPPRNDLLADPLIQDDPIVRAFADQASRGMPMPSVPEMAQVWEPMGNAVTFVSQGKQQPGPALNDAVNIIKQKIAAQKQ